MKEEAQEYLDQSALKDLIRKYSQFINFPIYLWDSKTESVEEPIEVESSQLSYCIYYLSCRKMKRLRKHQLRNQRRPRKMTRMKKLKLRRKKRKNQKQKRLVSTLKRCY